MAHAKKHKNQKKAGLGRKGGKQAGSGHNPRKKGKKTRIGALDSKASVAEAQDRKGHTNLGPSGQGTHRGRERDNRQTGVSGRPDISSAGRHPKKLKG